MDVLNKIYNAFSANCDKEDKKYIEIYKRYKDLLRSLKRDADTTAKVKEYVEKLESLYKEIILLNANNNSLISKI